MNPDYYLRKITFPDGFFHLEVIKLPTCWLQNSVLARINQLGYLTVDNTIQVDYIRINSLPRYSNHSST